MTEVGGRVAAVTGAARGIGRATAAALVRAGARVAMGDLDADLAAAAAAELGPAAVGLPLDVTSRVSFAGFLTAAEQRFGPLDVLVNNAGIMQIGEFLKEDDATARRQVEINVHGVLLGMKLALPGMIERNRGHVVNIASVAGKTGFAGGATYSATKHAVVGLTESVRAELAGTGVGASVVCPIVVDTELAAGLKSSLFPVIKPEDVAAAVVKVIRTGRAQAIVPRSAAVVVALSGALPPAARAAVSRLLRADRVLLDARSGERQRYEARAAASAPRIEPPAR